MPRPHFFIIGERKCGTSSLYRYLLDHPKVLPATRKELQFFTQDPSEVEAGFAQYLSHFPQPRSDHDETLHLCWPELDADGLLYEEDVPYQRKAGEVYVSGEASADTFSDVSPALLRRYLPELRLIVLLRDPVQRAFSHHRMLLRFQDEGRSLPRVIGHFECDMRAELSSANQPLLSPGLYFQTLERWVAEWGRDAILVLFTADLDQAVPRAALMQRVFAHLGLPPMTLPGAQARYNQAPRASMSPQIKEALTHYYRPDTIALQDFLGTELPWA